MLANILLVVHLLVAVAIVVLVLLQQGKGSDMGAAFGGGSSQSLFGARGSANFLSRATSILVTLFFISSLTLAYFYTRQSETAGVTDSAVIDEVQPADAVPDDDTAEATETESEPEPEAADVPAPPE